MMGQLISLKDVKAAHEKGECKVFIDEKTIITPSARDYAKDNSISFIEKKEEFKPMNKMDISGFSNEELYKILKVLVDRGLLNTEAKKYQYKKQADGFKLVDGSSMELEPLFEKTGDKVKYLEVMHTEDSPMQAGYFTMSNSSFEVTTEVFETYCIFEGNLDIKINGEEFRAKCGDIVNVPKGSHIECSSEGFTKVFYTSTDK